MKKTRRALEPSNRHVPQDVVPEILSWLPVKPLLRFRQVSRPWKGIIERDDFARLHLGRFNSGEQLESKLLVLHGTHMDSELSVKNIQTLRITKKFGPIDDIGTDDKIASKVIGAMDGLFILSKSRDDQLVVWNPSIRKTLILPPCPAPPEKLQYVEFGFGFDPYIEDYKHVRLVKDWESSGNSRSNVLYVLVYTLGPNSWERIEFRGKCCSTCSTSNRYSSAPLCCRGVLFAVEYLRLVSFDLNSNVFASTDLPTGELGGDWLGSQHLTLADGGASLALVNMTWRGGSIWLMEDLGASSSWTQRYTFEHENDDIYSLYHKFFFLKKNWEILLKGDDRVISFHLKTHEENTITRQKLHEAWAYRESLMMLNQE